MKPSDNPPLSADEFQARLQATMDRHIANKVPLRGVRLYPTGKRRRNRGAR